MHLLVAVDGSEESTAALDHAIDLATATGGSLVAVHAVVTDVHAERQGTPVPREEERSDEQLVEESMEEAEQRGEHVLADASERAADHGLTVETELLYGDPKTAIPEFAEETGADAIVVGHRSMPQEYEKVLGSVAKSLIEHAAVPVTVVT
jgi:nucleotide-binding universal stress UspA family protein